MKMRAKIRIDEVTINGYADQIKAFPVCGKAGADGVDEDNTYSAATPSGEIKLSICNPALRGQFKPGQVFYLDFTPAN
jgi:hypothetical protein